MSRSVGTVGCPSEYTIRVALADGRSVDCARSSLTIVKNDVADAESGYH